VGVFKECVFGLCTGREIHPKALTLPVDTSFWRELVAVHKMRLFPTPYGLFHQEISMTFT